MRKTLLAVAAALAIFSIGLVANRAEAMTAATPSALGMATQDASLVQKAAAICGYGGCVRFGPRRYYGYGYGYRRYYAPRRYYGYRGYRGYRRYGGYRRW
jgi:hypothetical protein